MTPEQRRQYQNTYYNTPEWQEYNKQYQKQYREDDEKKEIRRLYQYNYNRLPRVQEHKKQHNKQKYLERRKRLGIPDNVGKADYKIENLCTDCKTKWPKSKGLWCPDCGTRMRTKPIHRKKEVFRY